MKEYENRCYELDIIYSLITDTIIPKISKSTLQYMKGITNKYGKNFRSYSKTKFQSSIKHYENILNNFKDVVKDNEAWYKKNKKDLKDYEQENFEVKLKGIQKYL